MKDGLFFDAVLSAQLLDGVVRLGVAEVVGPEKDGKRQVSDPKMILTTLTGLLQLQLQINQMVDGLVDKKILTKREDATPPKGKAN